MFCSFQAEEDQGKTYRSVAFKSEKKIGLGAGRKL